MIEIMNLADKMKEEIQGAREYAKCYQRWKKEDPSKAKKYAEMADDEIKHSAYLHDFAVDIINDLKDRHVDYPEFMEMIWEEKHDEFIDKMAEVKMILNM